MKAGIVINVALGLTQLAIWHYLDSAFYLFGAGINFGMAIIGALVHAIFVKRGWQ